MNINLVMTVALTALALFGTTYFGLDQIKDEKRRIWWKAKYLSLITFPFRFVGTIVAAFYRRHGLQIRFFFYGFVTCIICLSKYMETILR